jgi:2'-5' RNA ligase
VRTFVAIFPPPEVGETLFRAARDLPASKDFRLTSREKIHLTLKFLGEVAQDDLARVTRALEPIRGRYEPFEVFISGFGAFPSQRKARILWAGIEGESGPLRAIAGDVEDLLEPLGFERESRPYVPHLTLGRARNRPAKLDGVKPTPPALRFTISSVELVQSVPGKNGVAYEILATYPFRNS